MYEDEIVSIKTARLLKDAGFPWDETMPMPAQHHALQWLREERKTHVDICPAGDLWNAIVIAIDDTLVNAVSELPCFKTYESATEMGIRESCEYLIKKQTQK